MLLDGSTLKARTTLMNTATDSYYYACEYACLNMYLYTYIYIFIYLFVHECLHSLLTDVSSGPLAAV